MKFKSIKDLPLVIGNVLDESNLIDKAFAMTIEEIPYFIMKHSANNRLRVLAPVTEFPIVEVENGVLAHCCEEEYHTELLETLIQLQSGIQQSREFKPIC